MAFLTSTKMAGLPARLNVARVGAARLAAITPRQRTEMTMYTPSYANAIATAWTVKRA